MRSEVGVQLRILTYSKDEETLEHEISLTKESPREDVVRDKLSPARKRGLHRNQACLHPTLGFPVSKRPMLAVHAVYFIMPAVSY